VKQGISFLAIGVKGLTERNDAGSRRIITRYFKELGASSRPLQFVDRHYRMNEYKKNE
jgi:hypothetical protein